MPSSNGVVDGLILLHDDLLRRAQAVEDYVSNYVGVHTPRNHTPKARNDEDALALLEDTLRQMRKDQEAVTLSLDRAQGKLRRFRNSLININSLPDEILLSIFQHASGRDLEEKMNIIEVCGRWRDLCLGHPKFWADFDGRPFPRHGIARAIKYSRSHPIWVHIHHDDEKKARKFIFANAQSIERLDVRVPDPTGQRKNVWLDRNWPMLRVLEFQSHNGRVLDVIVPPISGRMDKLRALTLQDVRFAYSPQNYRNLRYLRLMSDCADPDYRGVPRDGPFFDALRGSPNLEVLMLKDPPMPVDLVMLPLEAEVQLVHLPRLRTLMLAMATQKISLVFRHFRLSPTVLQYAEFITHRWRTEQDASYAKTDLRPVHDMDNTLVLQLPSPDVLPFLPRFQSLSIRFCDYQRIAGSFDALDDGYARWIDRYNQATNAGYIVDAECQPPLNLNLDYKIMDGNYYDADTLTAQAFDNFIRSVFRLYAPLTEIRVLRIDQAAGTEPLLGELPSAMPHLRTLVLHKCRVPVNVLNAFLAAGSASVDGARDLLPELATVVFVKCKLLIGDVDKLLETLRRLGLRLVVVHARKEEHTDENNHGLVEDNGDWEQVEPELLREGTGVDVEVRYFKPRPPKFDHRGFWYKRDPQPYDCDLGFGR